MKNMIGLVGLPGSGKNEVGSYIKTKGYTYISLSDILRNILLGLKIPDSRLNMQDLGDLLRESLGTEVLARGVKLIINKNKGQKFVIDGIRNPGELNFLKGKLQTFIIGIKMPDEKMLETIKKRGRPGDPKTLSDFNKMIKRELGFGEKDSGLQIKKCLEMSDVVINNDTTIKTLQKKVDEILS